MVRRLFIPLLIPLLILAAYLGWNWFQVKRFMDSLAEQAAPYASISYQSIPIAYKGEYSVKGVSIDPFDAGIPIRIDEVKLKTPDWQLMLLAGTPLETDQIPQQVSLLFSGLKFNTEARADSQPLLAILLEQPLLQGCNKADGRPVVMRDLQYGELNSTVELSYRFDPASQIVNINTDVLTARMSAMNIGIDFDVNADKLSKQALTLNPPQLLGVSVDYQDQGYNARLVDLCAESQGVSAEAFIDQQVKQAVDQAGQVGMQLPEQVQALYRELLLPGVDAKLALDLRHPLPVNVASQALNADSILDTIDIKMSINQQPVAMPELLIALNQSMAGTMPTVVDQPGLLQPELAAPQVTQSSEPEPVEENQTAPVTTQAAVAESTPEPASPAPVSRPEYQTVAANQLTSSMEGLEVKVDTHNGHLVTGEILKVTNDRMIVRQEFGNGVAEMPLLYKNARRIQVLR